MKSSKILSTTLAGTAVALSIINIVSAQVIGNSVQITAYPGTNGPVAALCQNGICATNLQGTNMNLSNLNSMMLENLATDTSVLPTSLLQPTIINNSQPNVLMRTIQSVPVVQSVQRTLPIIVQAESPNSFLSNLQIMMDMMQQYLDDQLNNLSDIFLGPGIQPSPILVPINNPEPQPNPTPVNPNPGTTTPANPQPENPAPSNPARSNPGNGNDGSDVNW
jgi:hypothetical protein